MPKKISNNKRLEVIRSARKEMVRITDAGALKGIFKQTVYQMERQLRPYQDLLSNQNRKGSPVAALVS